MLAASLQPFERTHDGDEAHQGHNIQRVTLPQLVQQGHRASCNAGDDVQVRLRAWRMGQGGGGRQAVRGGLAQMCVVQQEREEQLCLATHREARCAMTC